jgi:NADH-quinone oxidoreductase subunit A
MIAILLASLLLGISVLIRPSNPTREKLLTYESGVDPVGEGWSQSQIRYYVFALLFVVFDVEAVFIYPWATQLERYAGFGLVEMGVFVGVLLLGLVYAWRKGVLRWV